MAKQDGGDGNGTSVLGQLLAQDPRNGSAWPLLGGRPQQLPATLIAAGHELRAGDYDWHGLKRGSTEFCLIQYTLAGRGQLAWEGRRFSVLPGQAMVLWFPHDNRYWLAQGDSWRHVYLCLSGHEVMRAFRAVVARRGPLVALDRDGPTVAAIAGTYLRLQRGEVREAFTASAVAYAAAMALLAETLGPEPAATAHPGIAAAKRLAQERFAADLGVEELARAAGMSRHHFARRFAAAEGMPPSAFVADLRTREAVRLLAETGLSVAAIGARCGFRDPAYFCRAFRRLVGVSPGEFRNSGMY